MAVFVGKSEDVVDGKRLLARRGRLIFLEENNRQIAIVTTSSGAKYQQTKQIAKIAIKPKRTR